jgi:membrane protein involved in colicin uptake
MHTALKCLIRSAARSSAVILPVFLFAVLLGPPRRMCAQVVPSDTGEKVSATKDTGRRMTSEERLRQQQDRVREIIEQRREQRRKSSEEKREQDRQGRPDEPPAAEPAPEPAPPPPLPPPNPPASPRRLRRAKS